MTGEPDPLYILARRVLLDAIDALSDHRTAIVLVGAQAIYLHTDDADLAVAPYTTDADLALNPALLKPSPRLGDALESAGFHTSATALGIWTSNRAEITTDLLVPEAIAVGGRRSVDLGAHGNRVARKVRGLEAALVDNAPMTITALEPSDQRRPEILVAGPAALIVAKLHKLSERSAQPTRLKDKDALDVYRLLQATETDELAAMLRVLVADPRCSATTQDALGFLGDLFATPEAIGSQMAVRAVSVLGDPATIAQSIALLASDVLGAVAD